MNVSDLINSKELTLKEIIDIISEVNSSQKNELTPYYLDQYNGKHEILEKQDKVLKSGSFSELNKVILNYQKLITDLSAAFLVGEPINLNLLNVSDANSELFVKFKKHWETSKTDTILYQFVMSILIETRAAIQTLKSGNSVRHLVINSKNSTDFFLNLDNQNKADAFTRNFEQTDYDLTEKKVVENSLTDFYTENQRVVINTTDKNNITEVIPVSKINKIPIVYSQISEPDFAAVQDLIDRLEKIISLNADSNDYFAKPILVIDGQLVNSELNKDSRGDIIQIKNNSQGQKAELKYLIWDKQSESYKLEVDFLIDNIFNISSTARLDFNNLKGLGNISGVALKLMFLATTIKTKAHIQTWLNEAVTRLISVMKTQLGELTGEGNYNELEISFKFNDGLPINDKELMETLNIASQGATMSQETAVENNKFVQNASKEIDKLNEEKQQTFDGANVI